MPEMDFIHSAILEGLWQGLDAHEIASQIGESAAYVARIMDDFNSLGF